MCYGLPDRTGQQHLAILKSLIPFLFLSMFCKYLKCKNKGHPFYVCKQFQKYVKEPMLSDKKTSFFLYFLAECTAGAQILMSVVYPGLPQCTAAYVLKIFMYSLLLTSTIATFQEPCGGMSQKLNCGPESFLLSGLSLRCWINVGGLQEQSDRTLRSLWRK